jgi:(4S)-4-hydroxy-5-phosphonooxypentane-2,3-dione isomerase
MLIVHVFVQVKQGAAAAFQAATLENARASVQEPGVVRFDVIQERERPEHFVLIEIYRTADDPARHKGTAHYARWQGAVAEMMAQPRTSRVYEAVFPDPEGWERAGWERAQ